MLAIIPSRGGSKGLPGKNIRLLNGKPLIGYTIESAIEAKNINRVVVSTDDMEIAKIAKIYGAEIPFMRPQELATDNALAIDNYIYTIERLNTEFGGNYKEFVVLHPTSPLRTAEDIDNAIEIFKNRNAESVISVCEAPHPPLWAKEIDVHGILKNYFSLNTENKNRQELKKAYMPNGAVYVFKISLLKEKRVYYFEKTYPYVMPKERSIDIDDYFDFKLAEFLIKETAL